MKGRIFAIFAFASVLLSAYVFAFAETSNPVQIFVRPSVSCSGSPTPILLGQSAVSVTWMASVQPSLPDGSYTYIWSGSDSLSADQSTTTKLYSTLGTKSATIKVTPVIANLPSGVDLSKSASCSVEVVPPPPCGPYGDMNSDGMITSLDVTRIREIVLGHLSGGECANGVCTGEKKLADLTAGQGVPPILLPQKEAEGTPSY